MPTNPELGRTVLELKTESAQFFTDLNKAEAKAKGLGGAFGGAGREAKAFGGHVADAGTKGATSMDGLSGSIGNVGKTLVAAFSVAAIAGALKSYVTLTGKLQDLSSRLGMGTRALQLLGYAAKMNGADLEAVASAASKLFVKLAEGDASVVGGLKMLGLSVDELRAQGPDRIFFTIADAIAKVKDPLVQSAIGARLFAKGFGDVLPMLKGNLSATAAEAERLGLILSDDMIRAGDQLGDTLDTLGLSGQVLLARVLSPMAPALSTLAEWLGSLASTLIPWLQHQFSALIGTGMSVIGWLYRTAAAAADLAAKIPGAKALGIGASAADFRASAQWYEDAAAAQYRLTDATEQTTEAADKQRAAAAKLALALEAAARQGEHLKKVQDDLFGRTDIARALELVAALGSVANLSKLSAEKQEMLRQAVVGALEAFERLGQVAPAKMQKVYEALKLPLPSTSLATIEWFVRPAVEGMPGISKQVNFLQGLLVTSEALAQPMGIVADRSQEIADALEEAAAIDFARMTDQIGGWLQALQGFADVLMEIGDQAGGTAKGVAGTIGLAVDAVGDMMRGNVAAGALFVLKAGKLWDEIQRQQNELIAGNRALVNSFVETEGGVAALSAKLKLTGLEWEQWASYLERAKDSARLTEGAIAKLTEALKGLEARQEAVNEAVALVGEGITRWLAPIQKAKTALVDAQKAYEDLAAEPDADPLKLQEAARQVEAFRRALLTLGPEAQEAFELLASVTVDAFAAAFKTSGDFYGSLQRIGPLVEGLVEGQDTLGLHASGAINELLAIRRVQQEYDELLGPLNLATRAVQAMEQAGIRNDETYQLLARDVVKAHRAMIDGGKDANVAQALLQPTLQTLWKLWKDGTLAVDEETAALLAQAEQHGIVGKDQEAINQKMLDAFGGLTVAIEAMTLAIQAFGIEAGKAFSRARQGAELLGYAVPRGTPPVAGVPAPPGSVTPGLRARAVPRWHGGGVIGMQPVGASLWRSGEAYARAHAGLLVGPAARAADEVPILAQVGEGVLSRDVGMRTLAALNSGRLPGREVHQTVQVFLSGRLLTEVMAEGLPEFLRVVGGIR